MTTNWYESDTSDDDDLVELTNEDRIGLTNNLRVDDKKLKQYEQSREYRFCVAMVIILILAIGIVSGMFVAISQNDQTAEQSPIHVVKNLFTGNNQTLSSETTSAPISQQSMQRESIQNVASQSSKITLTTTTTTSKPTIKLTRPPTESPTIIVSRSTPTSNNKTLKSVNANIENGMSDELMTKLQKDYNIKFSGCGLNLRDCTDILNNGKLLTKIIVDNEYEIPYIYPDARTWSIKYPFAKDDKYMSNEYRRWCFNFYLFEFEAAQIDIEFKSFQVERGFDRVLIRHFNQSFSDPPIVISGRGQFNEDLYPHLIPKPLTYHLFKNDFKSICVEFETDDTINLEGIKFVVSVRYDDCKWNQWNQCLISDQISENQRSNKCGIGIHSKERTSSSAMIKFMKEQHPNDVIPDGFVDCTSIANYGPAYCFTSKCHSINDDSTNNDSSSNSFARLDPIYPDLRRIVTSDSSTPKSFKSMDVATEYMKSSSFINYPFIEIKDKNAFDLDKILKLLKEEKQQIVNQHLDERILSIALNKASKQNKEYLGARLLSSLLIGRTFTMIIVGDENTAKFRYDFTSSYPMQLQSRLRPLWKDIGVDGAAFNVRNIAINNQLRDNKQSLLTHIKASENVNYPFNQYNETKDDDNGFKHNEDMILHEVYDDDEEDISVLQSAALLNAIYAKMTLIRNNCEEDESFKPDDWSMLIQKQDKHDDNSIGIMHFEMAHCLDAICDEEQYKNLKFEDNLNVKAHRIQSDILVYNILNIIIEFIEKYETDINDKQNGVELRQWLLKKSGDLKKQYMETHIDEVIAPFALTSDGPNTWNIGFRLQDYIYNDYLTSNKGFDITNLNSLKLFGWNCTLQEPIVGRVVDKGNAFFPDRMFFRKKFEDFMQTKDDGKKFENQMKSINKDNVEDKRVALLGYYQRHKQEFTSYIMDNNLVLKIGILIPTMGKHNLFIMNGQNRADFIGNELDIYDLFLYPMDSKTKGKVNNSDLDLNKFLSDQRECEGFDGCLIKNIPSGKYILTIIPKNILELKDDVDDATLSIKSLVSL